MAIRYSPKTGLPQEYQAGPFDKEHYYVQWGGKLPGDESWSCGIRMAPVMTGTVQDEPTMQAAVATAVQAFHTRAGTFINQAAKLSFVKVNAIKVDGHYKFGSTSETVIADVGGDASGQQPYPNQIALAISLTTGFSRGPAHRGRFFLPLPGQIITTTGLITDSYLAPLKQSVTDFITALNAASTYCEVVVMSRKQGNPGTRKVTGTEIGKVLDTQRRRRRSLIENYV